MLNPDLANDGEGPDVTSGPVIAQVAFDAGWDLRTRWRLGDHDASPLDYVAYLGSDLFFHPQVMYALVDAEKRAHWEAGKAYTIENCQWLYSVLQDKAEAYFELVELFASFNENDELANPANQPPIYPYLSPREKPDELGRLGHFRVLREIGRGGMGVIFEVQVANSLIEGSHALKVVNPSQDMPERERKLRFVREAQNMNRVKHPNIVEIFNAAVLSDIMYIEMECVYGPTLDGLIQHHFPNPVPLPLAADLIRQTASALAAAHDHSRRIAHRDIKPGNILLQWLLEDDVAYPFDWRVRVCDFGLAAEAEQTGLTVKGNIMGTHLYLAPEQFDQILSGAEGDFRRCDVFALGSITYELVTGRHPFKGDTVGATSANIQLCQPKPPRSVNTAISEDLDHLILTMLDLLPDRRPTAQEVAARMSKLRGRKDDMTTGKPVSVSGSSHQPKMDHSPAIVEGVDELRPTPSERSSVRASSMLKIDAHSLGDQRHVVDRMQKLCNTHLSVTLNGYISIFLAVVDEPAAIKSGLMIDRPGDSSVAHCPFRPLDELELPGNALLILGEAGAGKTTALIELARDAIDKHRQNPANPIPVYFHLASWAATGGALKPWLIEMFNREYHITNSKSPESWLYNGNLLLLFDGLDAIDDVDCRTKCLEEINALQVEVAKTAPRLVVSSRRSEFYKCNYRLRGFQRAVCLKQLTDSQLDSYFMGKSELESLRDTLQTAMLRDWARSPLILDIMVKTYKGVVATELTTLRTSEEVVPFICNRFEATMFERMRTVSDQQTLLSPPRTQLPEPIERRCNKIRTVTRWLACHLSVTGSSTSAGGDMPADAPIFALDTFQPNWLGAGQATYASLVAFVTSISVSGLPAVLVIASLDPSDPLASLSGAIVVVIVIAVALWLGAAASCSKIETIEFVTWSPRQGIGCLGVFVLGAAFFSLAPALASWEPMSILDSFVWSMAFWVIIVGPLVFFFGGLSTSRVPGFQRNSFNFGIRRSLWNAVLTAVSFAGIVGAMHFASIFIIASATDSRVSAFRILTSLWYIGVLYVGSAVTGLSFGGFTVIRNWCLRVCLAWQGVLPLRCRPILDQAVALTFLAEFPGGYRFYNPVLQQYFAGGLKIQGTDASAEMSEQRDPDELTTPGAQIGTEAGRAMMAILIIGSSAFAGVVFACLLAVIHGILFERTWLALGLSATGAVVGAVLGLLLRGLRWWVLAGAVVGMLSTGLWLEIDDSWGDFGALIGTIIGILVVCVLIAAHLLGAKAAKKATGKIMQSEDRIQKNE